MVRIPSSQVAVLNRPGTSGSLDCPADHPDDLCRNYGIDNIDNADGINGIDNADGIEAVPVVPVSLISLTLVPCKICTLRGCDGAFQRIGAGDHQYSLCDSCYRHWQGSRLTAYEFLMQHYASRDEEVRLLQEWRRNNPELAMSAEGEYENDEEDEDDLWRFDPAPAARWGRFTVRLAVVIAFQFPCFLSLFLSPSLGPLRDGICVLLALLGLVAALPACRIVERKEEITLG